MSIVHVVGSSGGTTVTDRMPFYGARIPEDIKTMLKIIKSLDKHTFRKILRLIVSAMAGDIVDAAQLHGLKSDDLSEAIIDTIYTGLYSLLQCALRLPQMSMKNEMFKQDLQELKIPDEFIPDISSAVFGSQRPKVDEEILKNRPRLPTLETFRWRVDVGISTSVLSRVLEPSVYMEMTLDNGKIHHFEVPVSKFHDLRYNVAFVLKEMEDLEKRNILKIQD